jgi:endonuclease YncB( thermonuclease family)
MRFRWQTFRVSIAALLLGGLVAALPAVAAGKTQTFTGEVSDSMCGAKHMMEGSAAECTRACVGKGSKYALVVGDKVYTLDASDKATLSELDQLAGEQAKVVGTVDGDTIAVKSVTAGK